MKLTSRTGNSPALQQKSPFAYKNVAALIICFVVVGLTIIYTQALQPSAPTTTLSLDKSGALLDVDFSSAPVGAFNASVLQSSFNNNNGSIGNIGSVVFRGNESIVSENTPTGPNKFYRKNIQGGTCCNGAHGTTFTWRLNSGQNELYLAYRVRVKPGFNGVLGGKLPGFCGGTCNTGGRMPTGDGWSARTMWRANNYLSQYMYHLDQRDSQPEYGAGGVRLNVNYGDLPYYTTPPSTAIDLSPVGTPFRVSENWQYLEHYIKLNTPGQKDGIMRAWVDGKPALNLQNIRFRNVNGAVIDKLLFHIFFGGNTQNFAPTRDEYIDIDDVVVSTKKIVSQGGGTPSVALSVNPATVASGSTAQLSWSSNLLQANSCNLSSSPANLVPAPVAGLAASGAGATKTTNVLQNTTTANTTARFTISCSATTGQTVSSSADITITPVAPQPVGAPTITMQTASQTLRDYTLPLQAKASAASGAVVKSVEFYEDAALIATVTSPGAYGVYEYSWAPENNGDKKITAKVTDSLGQTAVTNAIMIKVLRTDLNNDTYVNIYDLSLLLGRYGQAYAPYDLDEKGIVDIIDLSRLISDWR